MSESQTCVGGQQADTRTGRDLILATRRFASENSLHSWWCIVSTAGLLATAIAGTLLPLPIPVRLIFSTLAGLLVLRFFVIYHDQQHHAILPKSKLAEALMRVFGILALSPSSVWRSSHNHHHQHNSRLRGSHIGSFPIMTKELFLKSPRKAQNTYLFMRHPLTILFGYVFVFIYGMCLAPFLSKPREHFDGLVAIVTHVTLGAAVTMVFGWQALVLAVLVPHFVTCALGTYLFYAQHNFPAVSFYDKAGWTYEKAALESSSHMKTGSVLAWFTGNIGYHHVHHLNPQIPFYRLREAFTAIPELRGAKATSLHPRDIIRCLRLKVWDVDLQRMVGL